MAPKRRKASAGSRGASEERPEKVSREIKPDVEIKEEDEEELEEVTMHLALTEEVRVKECKEEKVKVKHRGRKQANPKPKSPQFAFEWFRKASKDANNGQEPPLPQLVLEWKNLAEEERGSYITLAEEDRFRFEREYEEWRQKKAANGGKMEPTLEALLEKRRANLQRLIVRAEGGRPARRSVKKKNSGDASSKRKSTRIPAGFPQRPVKSAYGLFCSEQHGEIESQATEAIETTAPEAVHEELAAPVAAPVAAEGEVEADSGKAKGRGVSKLHALRRAWSNLSDEEKRSYAVRAAEDQERFRKELEAWRLDPANAEVANCDRVLEEVKLSNGRRASLGKASKLPRPRLKRHEVIARPDSSGEIMFDVLTGTQILAAQERKAREREERQSRREKEQAEPVPTDGKGDDSRAVEDFEDFLPGQPPADTSVDDLLGDLLAVETEEVLPDRSDPFQMGVADNPRAGAFDFGNELPQAAPMGPQLCLDESGNIVLNQSSLTRNVVTENPFEEDRESNVHEAVSQYEGAYKRTPRCVWTQSETDVFYEALSLYGSDLFLVQTFFRNKSAGQIKTKYNKEMKKNPKLVEEALILKSKRLTKETFEKLHGKIDTSRHYKPPPEPQPGEEPEAQEPMPEEEDDLGDLGGMPPPEPEYCAEDESLTTNRLMALFD